MKRVLVLLLVVGIFISGAFAAVVSLTGNTCEFRITEERNNQYHPKIYKNIVVWHDNRHGNWNIYGYDLSIRKEFQITTDKSDQLFPAIYEDMVVWYDYRSGRYWDIFRKNLSKEEGELFIKGTGLWDEDLYGVRELYVAIYGNIVVWEGWYHKWDIPVQLT